MADAPQPLSIGIIGVGGMGRRHAHNLRDSVKGATVAAVADADAERAAQIAAECPGARVFDNPYDLIAGEAVDAVLIVSPDPTHAGFTLACLEQNKPVLCEKPLATGPREAQTVVEAETALGQRLVSVGYMRRFDPAHVALKEALDGGSLGRPVLFRGVHRNAGAQPGLPRHLIVTGSAVHDIDSARWLLGQEVQEVFARGLRVDEQLDDYFHDMLLVQMTFGGDCLATIEVFVSARYGYEVLAEVVGARGAAVTTQPAGAVLRQSQRCATLVHHDWLERFQDAYVIELQQWVHALQRNQNPTCGASAWDGYVSLLVAQACIDSLESGRPQALDVPPRPGLYQDQR
ncbi:MAG TPA: Gfo/Idh/MocA family oxidoreductase [Candidatus Sulfomarinibacteraceae bacterium]|nr:Gfo/Idh/MocA family oxidoreductase [Candidatus Sulfomarinibacteraceae bacterium]